MSYPDDRVYYCKYCGKRFDFSAGYNSSRLVEHLFIRHHDDVMKSHGDLYLADLIKKCYRCRGGAHDRRALRFSTGH